MTTTVAAVSVSVSGHSADKDNCAPCQRTPDAVEPASFSWLLRNALPKTAIPLVQEAAAAYLDGGLSPPDVPDALCSSHWLALMPGSWPAAPMSLSAPRHMLEVAVVAVATAVAKVDMPHLRGLNINGLEWWLQEQCPDDQPKELHTDKAVGLNDDGEVMLAHPLVSSVLYLSASGGPTAIFKKNAVTLGFPSPASLLLFEGDLLHCVLHAPRAPLAVPISEEQPRRTLLVNLWATKPPGASEVELPTLPPLPEPPDSWTESFMVSNIDRVHDAQSSCALTLGSVAAPLSYSFASHAASWRIQELPDDLARDVALVEASRPMPLVVAHYPDLASDPCAFDTENGGAHA